MDRGTDMTVACRGYGGLDRRWVRRTIAVLDVVAPDRCERRALPPPSAPKFGVLHSGPRGLSGRCEASRSGTGVVVALRHDLTIAPAKHLVDSSVEPYAQLAVDPVMSSGDHLETGPHSVLLKHGNRLFVGAQRNDLIGISVQRDDRWHSALIEVRRERIRREAVRPSKNCLNLRALPPRP